MIVSNIYIVYRRRRDFLIFYLRLLRLIHFTYLPLNFASTFTSTSFDSKKLTFVKIDIHINFIEILHDERLYGISFILWSYLAWIYHILNKYDLLLNKKLLTIIIIIHSYMCIIQIEIHYVAYLDTRNK